MNMKDPGLPVWPEKALLSIGLHYRELQDIEVYIEDETSEVFYTEILNRLLGSGKIKKIIALGGRNKVVEVCKEYKQEYPALFIIDSDMDVFFNPSDEDVKRLYKLQHYCIENYLICPSASTEIVVESSGRMNRGEARKIIDWEGFLKGIEGPMLDLFSTFAVCWSVIPSVKTVGRGFYSVSYERDGFQELCKDRVNSLISMIEVEILKVISYEDFRRRKEDVIRNISERKCVSYSSGKDFLIPMLFHYLRRVGKITKMSMDSFKFRMARHCDLSDLKGLKLALLETMSNGVYISSMNEVDKFKSDADCA